MANQTHQATPSYLKDRQACRPTELLISSQYHAGNEKAKQKAARQEIYRDSLVVRDAEHCHRDFEKREKTRDRDKARWPQIQVVEPDEFDEADCCEEPGEDGELDLYEGPDWEDDPGWTEGFDEP